VFSRATPTLGLAGVGAAALLLTRSFLSARYYTRGDIQNGCGIVASHGSYVFKSGKAGALIGGPSLQEREATRLDAGRRQLHLAWRIGMTAPVFLCWGRFSLRSRQAGSGARRLVFLAGPLSTQRETKPAGHHRCRSNGPTQLGGDLLGGHLTGHAFELGDVAFRPAFKVGHTQHSLQKQNSDFKKVPKRCCKKKPRQRRQGLVLEYTRSCAKDRREASSRPTSEQCATART
jgi:hypothetical protein